MIHGAAGIGAGLVSLWAAGQYVRDILAGNTRPSRVTWWVLGFINLMLVVSGYAEGARSTLWLPLCYAVAFSGIGVLSLRYGEGAWTRTDTGCAALSALALAAWWATREPATATALLIAADFAGLWPTIQKAFRSPGSESREAWLLGAAAGALNILAIDDWRPVIAAYPIYVFATNAVILAPLLRYGGVRG